MAPSILTSPRMASPPESEIPNDVSLPPPTPSIPVLKNPLTVKPGGVFGKNIVHGDGVSDDTAGIQAALDAGDVVVAPATYAISGNVTIPTGRNILCRRGGTFLDTQSKGTRMFQIGWANPASNGSNSIVGCTFMGTDTAADYSTYKGGTSGYSELLVISTGGGQHTDNVLIENDSFMDAQGDSVLTYSPCGTNNKGMEPCNGGAPGTEGPSHIYIVNDKVSHCAQPGIHLNGGQNIVVTGLISTDCNNDNEVDPNVLQLMSTWWHDNKFTTMYGTLNALNNRLYGPDHTCSGATYTAQDSSRCYSYNNNIDGVGAGGPSVLLEPPSNCATGLVPGHYTNESLTNGAKLSRRC